jgi:hypothetical protein
VVTGSNSFKYYGGFPCIGIYPFNSETIPDEAFAPSLITKQDHGENEVPGQIDILGKRPNTKILLPTCKKEKGSEMTTNTVYHLIVRTEVTKSHSPVMIHPRS